jgi:hypothetical protein
MCHAQARDGIEHGNSFVILSGYEASIAGNG